MAIDANSDIINTSYYIRQLFTKTLDQIRKSFFTTHKQKVVHSKLILSRCLWRLLGCWLRCIECWLWWCIGCIWGSLLYCPGCIEGRPWCCPRRCFWWLRCSSWESPWGMLCFTNFSSTFVYRLHIFIRSSSLLRFIAIPLLPRLFSTSPRIMTFFVTYLAPNLCPSNL